MEEYEGTIITHSRIFLHIFVFHNKLIKNQVKHFKCHNMILYLIPYKVAVWCFLGCLLMINPRQKVGEQ